MRGPILAVCCCLAAAAPPRAAEPAPPKALPALQMTLTDLSPKFLAFYAAAEREKAPPDRRWELWKKMYDFAAVPPTPEGDAIARRLLDQAWPRYPAVMARIRAGGGPILPEARAALRSVAGLLRPEVPIDVRLLVYVGALEGNAFTMADHGKITTAIPVESAPGPRALVMTHELTHAVEIGMGSLAGGYERTIGAVAVPEGLASRVTQKLFPGRPDAESIEYTPGWLAKAGKRQAEILKGIRPFLTSRKPDDIMRFTMGTGPAGLEREAYYAGWVVVGYWLSHGMSFADVARIPEAEMPRRMADTIDTLLGARPGREPHGR
ncbi:MAG: hypothetical protein M3O15_02850 [Acidobacteriota bacterium]|nr:hypothetical protein [Acidobacteriota bacterium]